MDSAPVVIPLPRTSYLVVIFLFFACFTVGFGAHGSQGLRDSTGHSGFDGFDVGPQTLVFAVPLLVAIFIARTATIVSSDGLRVRALFASRMLRWDEIRGLTVSGRAVYAVVDGGAIRLPCVRLAHLCPISPISGGRVCR